MGAPLRKTPRAATRSALNLSALLSVILLAGLASGCASDPPALIEGIEAGESHKPHEKTHDTPQEPPYSRSPDGSLHRHLSAGKLKFIEIVPEGVDPKAALPILIHFHGLADMPRLPAAGTRHPSIPARILLPRGPYLFEKGFAWYPYRVRENRREEMKRALEGTAHHLARFYNEVGERFRPPCKPISVGFSQGGMITLAAALLRPESLSAAIALASYLPPELIPEGAGDGSLSIRMIHGLDDRIVPHEPTVAISETMKARGFDVELSLLEGMQHASTPESDRLLGEAIRAALAKCIKDDASSELMDTAFIAESP